MLTISDQMHMERNYEKDKEKYDLIKMILCYFIIVIGIIFVGFYSATDGFTKNKKDIDNNSYYNSYYRSYDIDDFTMPEPSNGSYYTSEELHKIVQQYEDMKNGRYK